MPNSTYALLSHVKDILSKPSPVAEKQLRNIMDLDPDLMERVVNLAKRTRAMIIEHTWPSQATKIAKEIDELIQILRNESTSMLELLVIESICTSMVRLYGIEQYYTIIAFKKPISRSTIMVFEKMLNESQKRFLKAVAQLAQLRRLAIRTPIQLNIAQSQVNVVKNPAIGEIG